MRTLLALLLLASGLQAGVDVTLDGPTKEFLAPALAISRGLNGYIYVNKFGRNNDVDTANVPEAIWMHGGAWVEPTTPRKHTIYSTSTGDADGQNGARTVQISGVNHLYNLATETVTLAGTTGASTAFTYAMIHRQVVLTAGTSTANVGEILAVADTDGTTTSAIAIGYNQTQESFFMVPLSYTAYLTRISVGCQSSGLVDAEFRAKPFGGVWNIKHNIQVGSSGAGGASDSKELENYYNPYPSFAAKTLLRGTVVSSAANNTDINLEYDLVLVPTP